MTTQEAKGIANGPKDKRTRKGEFLYEVINRVGLVGFLTMAMAIVAFSISAIGKSSLEEFFKAYGALSSQIVVVLVVTTTLLMLMRISLQRQKITQKEIERLAEEKYTMQAELMKRHEVQKHQLMEVEKRSYVERAQLEAILRHEHEIRSKEMDEWRRRLYDELIMASRTSDEFGIRIKALSSEMRRLVAQHPELRSELTHTFELVKQLEEAMETTKPRLK